MGLRPLTYEDTLYQLLRDGNIKEFNRRKAQGEQHDLTFCDLRYLDLRGLDAAGIDLSNSRLLQNPLGVLRRDSGRVERI